jgi:hypothetical protein
MEDYLPVIIFGVLMLMIVIKVFSDRLSGSTKVSQSDPRGRAYDDDPAYYDVERANVQDDEPYDDDEVI